MDIEGFEYDVLQSVSPDLLSRFKVIVVCKANSPGLQ